MRRGGLAPHDVPAVSAMAGALRHRGPDGYSIAQEGGIALGQTWLDLTGGTTGERPLARSADGRYSLAYDGTLYNTRELRSALVALGWTAPASFDAEILLALFALRGADCLPMLNGMFAFAVWDGYERELFLVRDRFGQKPLFYALAGDLFVFASAARPLFLNPELKRAADHNALFHYLTVQSVPAPLSAFAGVSKLRPARCLRLRPGASPEEKSYWRPDGRALFGGSAREAEEELDGLLRGAVARHYPAGDLAGIFLSGGVDSSLVAALAASRQSALQGFALGFAEQTHDERPFATRAAKVCGLPLEFVLASEAALPAQVMDMVRHYGEPFADSSALAAWQVAELAATRVRVCLSGDGGDDLFGGYARYLDPFLFPPEENSSFNTDDPVRVQFARELADCGRTDCLPLLGAAQARYYAHWACLYGERKSALCGEALRSAANPRSSLLFFLDRLARDPSRHLLSAIMDFERELYLASTLTVKTDVAAMAFSLEVRAPMLDAELADFALSLPVGMKVRRLRGPEHGSLRLGYEPKWLLKRVARRYFSRKFVYRRKQGFGVPLGLWLRGPLRELACDTLLSSRCAERGWIESGMLRRLVNEHMDGAQNHQYGLWALLMLELWARLCLDEA